MDAIRRPRTAPRMRIRAGGRSRRIRVPRRRVNADRASGQGGAPGGPARRMNGPPASRMPGSTTCRPPIRPIRPKHDGGATMPATHHQSPASRITRSRPLRTPPVHRSRIRSAEPAPGKPAAVARRVPKGRDRVIRHPRAPCRFPPPGCAQGGFRGVPERLPSRLPGMAYTQVVFGPAMRLALARRDRQPRGVHRLRGRSLGSARAPGMDRRAHGWCSDPRCASPWLGVTAGPGAYLASAGLGSARGPQSARAVQR
jgi:hypothetical protein